ncbi:MAG: hypothetical protein EA369_01045 [Bradymonadales bacterium]|nr:MAG: hypothetical protein EA369_01045 [Bradymonadales bacterium]
MLLSACLDAPVSGWSRFAEWGCENAFTVCQGPGELVVRKGEEVWMRYLISIGLFLFLVCLKAELGATSFRSEWAGEFAWSDLRDSWSLNTGFARETPKGQEVRLGFLVEERSFNLGESFQDHQLQLGGRWKPGSKIFFELDGAHSFSPDFLARWQAKTSMHIIYRSFEFFQVVEFRNYQAENSLSLQPGFLFSASDQVQLLFRTNWSLKPSQNLSFIGGFFVTWSSQLGTRVYLSGGRADEGDAVFDEFFAVALLQSFQISEFVSFRVAYREYFGDLRRERSLGLGLSLRGRGAEMAEKKTKF